MIPDVSEIGTPKENAAKYTWRNGFFVTPYFDFRMGFLNGFDACRVVLVSMCQKNVCWNQILIIQGLEPPLSIVWVDNRNNTMNSIDKCRIHIRPRAHLCDPYFDLIVSVGDGKFTLGEEHVCPSSDTQSMVRRLIGPP